MKYFVVSIVVVLTLAAGYLIYANYKSNQTEPACISCTDSTAGRPTQSTATATQTAVSTTATITTTTTAASFTSPVAQFKERVTKKPFGIYITPQNSPVQPERFTGYHTGADAEYEDVTEDVPVYALADAKAVLARTASGYGGVVMIEFTLNDARHTALYGHIRPSTLPSTGQEFKKGEQIGLLGTGYTSETGGERRHLHFAILSDNRIDLKGYVPNQSDLPGWIDPLTLY